MHTALWLLTLQTAVGAHCSGMQGSRHFCPIHARCRGHSGSVTHSGLGAKNSAEYSGCYHPFHNTYVL